MPDRPYRILLPVTKSTATVPVLEIASSLIRSHGGEVVALGVVKVPVERPYSYGTMRAYRSRRLIKRLTESDQAKEIAIRSVVKVGREVAPEIVKAAKEQDCDLLVLGWDMASERRHLGGKLSELIKEADRDIAIIKPGQVRKRHNVLVPMRAGVHSTLALDIAGAICKQFGAKLTVMHIFDSEDELGQGMADRQPEPISPIGDGEHPETISVSSDDVAATILEEGDRFDFIILGASIRSSGRQGLGDIPKFVARKSRSTVIIVNSRQPDPIPTPPKSACCPTDKYHRTYQVEVWATAQR